MATITNLTKQSLKNKVRSEDINADVVTENLGKCVNNMRCFGLPYQFIKSTDPRYENVSTAVGRRFVSNVILDAPIAYIIPGKPIFLPNKSSKDSTASAFISAANGNFEPLKSRLSNNPSEKLRYYDFQSDYGEYMKYVNVMCRSAAAFLELHETIKCKDCDVKFQQYDWKNYRWDSPHYTSGIAKGNTNMMLSITKKANGLISSITSGLTNNSKNTANETITFDDEVGIFEGYATSNYVQFYVDPTSSCQIEASNSTAASKVKEGLDTLSSSMKEMQFLANSAGVELGDLSKFGDGAMGVFNSMMSNAGSIGTILGRIATAGSTVIKGENIMIPEIYQNSDFGRDYTLTVHLKAPYGNKFGIYMDVIVPLLHLLALAIPRQSTSNTYGSPFLIKCFFPGVFNCNLGIVTAIHIENTVSNESWTTDHLPNEIDVTLQIKDLYSDMVLSPSSDPSLFLNNNSMIDYLATITGQSLITPQTKNKIELFLSAYTAAFKDIDDNAVSMIYDHIESKLSKWLY